MNKRSFFSWLCAGIAALTLAACGSSNSDSSDPPTVRLVNLTSADDLLLTADSDEIVSGVTSGGASAYKSIDADTYSIVVSSASTELSTSSTSSVTLVKDTDYTIVAYERNSQIKILAITESTEADDISSGYAQMTVRNAGSDAGSVDIYIVDPGVTDLSDLSPTFSSVSANGTSLSNLVSDGTYDLIVTKAGTTDDVRLTMSSVELTSQEIVTLVLTPTQGGSLVNGGLVVQDDSVTPYTNTQARVRVVAAFPSTTSNLPVDVSIGGEDLDEIVAPSLGLYALVDGDTSTYTVSVDGTDVATLPSATFESGGDYTVLVYGTDTSDAAVNVLTDTNQIPSTGAKIRLVNAAVSTAGVSLLVNSTTLTSSIAYGDVSDYVSVSTGSNTLSLYSPASSSLVVNYSYPDLSNPVSIYSGGVYTLFLLGETSNAVTLLNKDR